MQEPSGQVFLCIDYREIKKIPTYRLVFDVLSLVLLINSILIMILMITTAEMRSHGKELWMIIT